MVEVSRDPAAAPKRTRRPSLTRTIRAARKLGATAVTLPNGARLHFDREDVGDANEWDSV
jgi:hypothetical protein